MLLLATSQLANGNHLLPVLPRPVEVTLVSGERVRVRMTGRVDVAEVGLPATIGLAGPGSADLTIIASTGESPRWVEIADIIVATNSISAADARGLLARWPGAYLAVAPLSAAEYLLVGRPAHGIGPSVVRGSLGDAVLCACVTHCWRADQRPHLELAGALVRVPRRYWIGRRRLRITAAGAAS